MGLFVLPLLAVLFANLQVSTSSAASARGQPHAILPTRALEAQTRIEALLSRRQSKSNGLAQDQIFLDISAPVSEVDPQFLSVTIDAGEISSNWSGIDFTAQRIINMASGLSPAMLRVGGTSGDFLIFNSSSDKTGMKS